MWSFRHYFRQTHAFNKDRVNNLTYTYIDLYFKLNPHVLHEYNIGQRLPLVLRILVISVGVCLTPPDMTGYTLDSTVKLTLPGHLCTHLFKIVRIVFSLDISFRVINMNIVATVKIRVNIQIKITTNNIAFIFKTFNNYTIIVFIGIIGVWTVSCLLDHAY